MALSEIADTGQSRQRLAAALAGLSAEHIAYMGIALVAGLLRFVDLGHSPLSPGEAGEALAVWQLWQPGGAAVTPGSPAYFALTSVLSQVLGFSDSVMRLAPALVGFALVLTPWFVRHRLGRLGALLTALLLAVSPLHVLAARTAGGQSLALLAGMMFFVSWLRFQETGRRAWVYLLAAALAVGLTTSPLFFSILATLLVAWLAQRLIGPALIKDEDGRRAALIRPPGPVLRRAAIIGLATLLLLATTSFLALRGVGSAADLVTGWLGRFQLPYSRYILTGPFAGLLRYEAGLLILGLPAAIWAATKDKPWPIFLVYWALGALLLLVVQPGTMANVLALTLPGYLLVGRFVNDVFDRAASSWWWTFAAAILFAGAVFYLNLVRYARLAGLQGVPDPTYHLLMAILSLLVILALATLLFSWERSATTRGLVVGFLALLLVFTWGSSWWLSREAANDTRERWIESGTDVDIRLIRQTIEELSWQADNSLNGVALDSAIDTPALRWYLRDFGQARFATTLPVATASPVLITPLDYDPAVAGSYIGAEYTYARPDTVHALGRIDALRWWLFHQSPIPVSEESLILWLRSDIAEGSP